MAASELPINTLLGYTDDELVEHMRKNRQPDGRFSLDVKDWHILTSVERDKLAESLK